MSESSDHAEEDVVEQVEEAHTGSDFIYAEEEPNAQSDEVDQEVADTPEEQSGVDDGSKRVTTYFHEGSLGVNLHRRPDDGIVHVIEIVTGSQAVDLDIQVGDELWSVGTNDVEGKFLDRESWQGLVEYIKKSTRPLEIVWRRPEHPIPHVRSKLSMRASHSPVHSPEPVAEPTRSTSPIHSPTIEVAPTVHQEAETEEGEESEKEQSEEEEEEEPEVEKIPATYRVLEAVLASLVKKPSHPKDSLKQDFAYNYLLNHERRVLRRGDLTTPGATTLWMKTLITKHVILLTDMLIITIPVKVHKLQCYQVEHIIDLQACKLRSEGQVFGGGLDSKTGPNSVTPPPKSSHHTDTSHAAFQIIWPGGCLELTAESKEVKEVWVLNLFLAICTRVGGESDGQGQVLGWRHQYMLGTMHSAVLSHDEQRVRELVAMCDAGEMEFSTCIDAIDEGGYTPLHYACIMRMHGIIRALHEAAADVTAQDHRGLTPLHWAAMQLDDYTLSLLCSHVFDLDLTDKQNRTPLYMACVEGRDVEGHTDTAALKKCVACMLTHQPNVNTYDKAGYTMLHYLSASWQWEAAELLITAEADVNARCAGTGMTPLHLACLASPIKLAEGEAKRIIKGADLSSTEISETTSSLYEKINHPFGSMMLRTLLKAGARPNAKDSKGRTALHILAEPGRDDLWDLMELTDAVAVLVSFGARFDDSALLQGLKNKLLGVSVEALVERWGSLPVINGDALNLSLTCFKHGDASVKHNGASTDSGGSRRVTQSPGMAHNTSSQRMSVNSASHSSSAHNLNNGLNRSNSNKGVITLSFTSGHPAPVFPPDPTDKCSMCLFSFTLFKRAHHCRLCEALCCDECSKKRCLVEYSQVRTCDSCYNKVMDLQEKRNRDEMLSKMKPIPRVLSSNASKQYLENRSKLLAEADEDKAGDPTTPGGRRQNNTSQTMNTLNETHVKMLERGEKLSKLAESSNLMASQANDFAKMAKALNEQQKSRWF
eukprot:gene9188-10842_t